MSRSEGAAGAVAGIGLFLTIWCMFISDAAGKQQPKEPQEPEEPEEPELEPGPIPDRPPPKSGGGGGGGWMGPTAPTDPIMPTIPTRPPEPRATPKTVTLEALHRYRVVADVLVVKSLGDFASRVLPRLSMRSVDLKDRQPVVRDGRKMERVTFEANMLIPQKLELEREQAFAGVGSVWIVSAVDVTKTR